MCEHGTADQAYGEERQDPAGRQQESAQDVAGPVAAGHDASHAEDHHHHPAAGRGYDEAAATEVSPAHAEDQQRRVGRRECGVAAREGATSQVFGDLDELGTGTRSHDQAIDD